MKIHIVFTLTMFAAIGACSPTISEPVKHEAKAAVASEPLGKAVSPIEKKIPNAAKRSAATRIPTGGKRQVHPDSMLSSHTPGRTVIENAVVQKTTKSTESAQVENGKTTVNETASGIGDDIRTLAGTLSAHDTTTAQGAIEDTVTRVREAVRTEEGKTSVQALEMKLREIIMPVFDFEEMSKLCLGQNWKAVTPDQQKEFVKLFSELLARTYLRKIRENAADSEFAVLRNSNLAPDRTLVQTKINYKGDQASIDYRLRLEEGRWRIYDVVIENVGLVSNYRSEFASILRKENFDGLLASLRAKK